MSYTHIYVCTTEFDFTFNYFVVFKNKSCGFFSVCMYVLADKIIKKLYVYCIWFFYKLPSLLTSIGLTPLSCIVNIVVKTMTSDLLQDSKSAILLWLINFKHTELH